MLWIFLTLLATVFQTIRNSFAKKLSLQVDPMSVSFSRFFFGLPVSLAVLFWFYSWGMSIQIVSEKFWIWALLFSIVQIGGNVLLIVLFRFKNFAVAVTYTKTEGVFTAILAVVLLGEHLSPKGWLGVVIAFLGLLMASFAKKKLSASNILKQFGQQPTMIGLLSGLLFALAVISIKFSFAYLQAGNKLLISVFALFATQLIQIGLLLPYLLLRRHQNLLTMFRRWQNPLGVGLFSGMGTLAWFIAFSLAYVGYVKTLGQFEFVLSVLLSVYYFKEKISRNEILGMLLMVIGTLLLLLWGQTAR